MGVRLDFDCAVVGAGVEGAATAYTLAGYGKRTVLFDQFPLHHSRGSSSGFSRITRRVYDSGEPYVSMAQKSFDLWDRLANEAKLKLFTKTGILRIRQGDAAIQKVAQPLRREGLDHELLTADQIRDRFKPLSFFGQNWGAVYDPEGGLLHVQNCLTAFYQVFQNRGGTIKENVNVIAIKPLADAILVRTSAGDYVVGRVALCTGPWGDRLLRPLGGIQKLPLKPKVTVATFWRVENGRDYSAVSGFPCLIGDFDEQDNERNERAPNAHIYALPALEYPGLFKVIFRSLGYMEDAYKHTLCQQTPGYETNERLVNPDFRDLPTVTEERKLWSDAAEYLRQFCPGIDHRAPAIIEKCMITYTPDEGFIIDRHPHHPNITFALGMSGHGFKLAPVVGEMLAQLTAYGKSTYDLSPFKLLRFNQSKAKI